MYGLVKINNALISPISVLRGISQGCPSFGLLYGLAIEPLLVWLREKLSGFSAFPNEPPIKVIAYADDVCAVIQTQDDVCELLQPLENFGVSCSAKVNWSKSYASFFGLPSSFSFPSLPGNLSWKNDGVYHLGVHLGDSRCIQKKLGWFKH